MLDLLLSIIIWLIKTLLVPILPVEVPFFPLATFTGSLDAVKDIFISSLAGLGNFLDINLMFNLVGVIIYAELILIVFKAAVFMINLGRGSGA